MPPAPVTLVLGIGNPTRSDDAAGWRVAEAVDRGGLPDVEVRTTQQLTPEWAETWSRYQRVILIDARLGGDEVLLERVPETPAPTTAASHALDVATLVGLIGALGLPCPEIHVCSVRADCLEFGASISPEFDRRLQEATRRILEFLAPFSRPPTEPD